MAQVKVGNKGYAKLDATKEQGLKDRIDSLTTASDVGNIKKPKK